MKNEKGIVILFVIAVICLIGFAIITWLGGNRPEGTSAYDSCISQNLASGLTQTEAENACAYLLTEGPTTPGPENEDDNG